MPALLAIDTATERTSLALVAGDAQVHLHEGAGGAAASQELIPAALALLARAGLTLRELDGYAYGRGPGAFTGLRTACSVVQGFAYGCGRPVLAIDSLLLVADDARAQGGADDVWVAMDARMNEVYAAAYRHDGAGWRGLVAPALYTLEALDAAWQEAPPHCIAGSALAAYAGRLDSRGARVVLHERSRAAALARLARAGWQRGEAADAAAAQPLYLRDKVALTSAERAARGGAP